MKRRDSVTMLSKIRIEGLCKCFKLGHNINDACRLTGTSPHTYYWWMRAARKIEAELTREDNPRKRKDLVRSEVLWLTLLESVEAAEAHAIERALYHVQKAAEAGSWQAAAWFLERKRPHEWGRRFIVDTAGADKSEMPSVSDIVQEMIRRTIGGKKPRGSGNGNGRRKSKAKRSTARTNSDSD